MLSWLLEHDFMPHGHCYYWRPDILWTHVISDAVIAVAYFSIPVTLLYFLRRRRDIPFPGLIALFAAFILLCGTTHLIAIWTVWQPVYAVEGVVKALTAVVSIFTALAMIPFIPEALAMRSPTELEAANRQLLAEVERRREAERRLEAAVANLRRSNEELEQFAYAASHDLQGPLRSVVSFSQMLEQTSRDRLGKEALEYLGFIREGGKRMQSLIQDLLQLSRIGVHPGATEPVSTQAVAKQVLDQLQSDLGQARAVIHTGQLPVVSGDPGQLGQLFQNLIANGIKFHLPGVQPELRIDATREGDKWHFVFSDNGIGIPAEHLEAIFVIFRRLHTSEEFPGSGIGLALCRKIVERHGGRIWAESTPGQGSRFHFTLPVADSGPGPEAGSGGK
jgi:signal transduction histidine kinase